MLMLDTCFCEYSIPCLGQKQFFSHKFGKNAMGNAFLFLFLFCFVLFCFVLFCLENDMQNAGFFSKSIFGPLFFIFFGHFMVNFYQKAKNWARYVMLCSKSESKNARGYVTQTFLPPPFGLTIKNWKQSIFKWGIKWWIEHCRLQMHHVNQMLDSNIKTGFSKIIFQTMSKITKL